MIYLFNPDKEITADISEIYRYSGFNGSVPDADMCRLTEKIKAELETAAVFKLCYTKKALNGHTLDFGIGEINSKSLAKNLKGCDGVYIFAATVGIEVDRIIRRYSTLSPSKAVIAQAVGAALIEGLCDCFCGCIKKEEEKKGFFLRPRFSPGYGDFDISCQREIINFLDAPKRAGITLTDSLLMLPTKSVTAVMGVSKSDSGCNISGCEACIKKDCEFRRNQRKGT